MGAQDPRRSAFYRRHRLEGLQHLNEPGQAGPGQPSHLTLLLNAFGPGLDDRRLLWLGLLARAPEGRAAGLLAEAGLSEENAAFAQELVNGVIQNKEEIDHNIQNFAPAWPIKQIPVVDRNILRLAIFEILLDNKVPVKVAINEAVELAKTFGSDNSPRFVNGVLGSVSALARR